MRFMMLMIPKGYETAAPGAMPSAEAVAAMMKYNEELQKAGVLLSLDGLHPPSAGVRVSFAGGKPTATDGPFAESKEVLGGYWMIRVNSKEEAVEWAQRCPGSSNEIIEIRQVQEMEDFPADVQQAAAGFDEMQKQAAHRSEKNKQDLVPCLWFDRNAEEAVNFYTSIFKNSKIGNVSRYTEGGQEVHGMPAGTALMIEFELDGRPFTALNGGPVFKFNEAVSFQVHCEAQEEVDYYWSKLGEGGDVAAQQCGWLKDKFGLSWQIVPIVIIKLMTDKDVAKSGRVMNALMKMKKIDIAKLQEAYDEK